MAGEVLERVLGEWAGGWYCDGHGLVYYVVIY